MVEETQTMSTRGAGFRSAEDAELLSPLAREHANCTAALEWCQAQGYAEPCLRLAVGMWWF
jgi:hypothetical protein